MKPSDRWLMILFCLALAVRLSYAWVLRDDQPWLLDEESYYRAARIVAVEGPRLPRDGTLGPLLTGWIAGILLVGGDGPGAARAAMAVPGAVAAVLTALIGREVLGRGLGWLAGTLAAVWPAIVFWQGLVMTEALGTVLLLGSIWLIVRFRPRPGLVWPPLLVGALLGAASTLRPNLLATLPILMGWVWLAPGLARLWRGRIIGLLLIGYGLVMLPWWHRQYEIQETFVLATVKTGDLLLGANNPVTYAGPESYGWIDPAGLDGWWSPGWESLTQAERDRRRTAAALDFVRQNLGRLPDLAAWRSIDYWQAHLGQSRADTPGSPHASAPFQAAHLIVLALAATGALTLGPIHRGVGLLAAIVLSGWLTGVLLWGGGGRFVAPYQPLLLILATAGLGALVRGWRRDQCASSGHSATPSTGARSRNP